MVKHFSEGFFCWVFCVYGFFCCLLCWLLKPFEEMASREVIGQLHWFSHLLEVSDPLKGNLPALESHRQIHVFWNGKELITGHQIEKMDNIYTPSHSVVGDTIAAVEHLLCDLLASVLNFSYNDSNI